MADPDFHQNLTFALARALRARDPAADSAAMPSEPSTRTVKVLMGPPANPDTAPPQSKIMKFLMSTPADTWPQLQKGNPK